VIVVDVREESVVGVVQAIAALKKGELAVLPTDTVYGVAADAFSPAAVERLLAAKGRGRDMPVPVLVGAANGLDGLAEHVTDDMRALVEAFWPGALTLIVPAAASLAWDLGETRGTVAVRMPDDEVALAVLERTGPLAVSSANITGRPAARDADEAEQMLGADVEVVVDGGSAPGGQASTIVDCTGPQGRVLRRGALSLEELNEVLEPLGVALTDEP
jgi:L-threonylcarbamoyladenylate synthase